MIIMIIIKLILALKMLALKMLAQIKKLNTNKSLEVRKKNQFLVIFLVAPKITVHILNLLQKTMTAII